MEALATILRDQLAARRRRDRFLPAELLGEPGWDLLLDLGLARFEHRAVSVTSACIAANVPATTGLRWIGLLSVRGYIVRYQDLHDGRRSFVRLTDKGLKALADSFGVQLDQSARAA